MDVIATELHSCSRLGIGERHKYFANVFFEKAGMIVGKTGHCVRSGAVPRTGKLCPNSIVSPRRFLPVVRAASTSQSQIADVKRLKGIRMRPRTPEDDEKQVRHGTPALAFRLADPHPRCPFAATSGPTIGRILGRVRTEGVAIMICRVLTVLLLSSLSNFLCLLLAPRWAGAG